MISNKNNILNDSNHITHISLLDYLPDEMQLYLMFFLDHKSTLNMGVVSRKYELFAKEDKLWEELLKKDYNVDFNTFLSNFLTYVPNQKVSPKSLYRFLNLFRLYNKAALNGWARAFQPFNPMNIFAETLPTTAFTLQYVLAYQENAFLLPHLRTLDFEKLSQLMNKIYSYAEEHTYLAFVMLHHGSHSLPNLNVKNLAILKILLALHLQKFSILDLTQEAFKGHELEILNFVRDAAKETALFNTLVLPNELGWGMDMNLYYDAFPNLETLVAKCNSNVSYQSEVENEVWPVFLENTRLKRIIIQNEDNTQNFTFTKVAQLTNNL